MRSSKLVAPFMYHRKRYAVDVVRIMKEISDSGVLVEGNSAVEAVNLDFIIRIREYPRNKKGKEKSLILD